MYVLLRFGRHAIEAYPHSLGTLTEAVSKAAELADTDEDNALWEVYELKAPLTSFRKDPEQP